MGNEPIFVDTSAFYALMDRSDLNHAKAAASWPALLENSPGLVTCNYIVIEAAALMQSRLGFQAAEVWYRDVLSLAMVVWVDETIHGQGRELWLGLGRRRLSLVDCVSFTLMRRMEIAKAFAYDSHFVDHQIAPKSKTSRHSPNSKGTVPVCASFIFTYCSLSNRKTSATLAPISTMM